MGFLDFVVSSVGNAAKDIKQKVIKQEWDNLKNMDVGDIKRLISTIDNGLKRRIGILVLVHHGDMYGARSLIRQYNFSKKSFEIFVDVKETKESALCLMEELSRNWGVSMILCK